MREPTPALRAREEATMSEEHAVQAVVDEALAKQVEMLEKARAEWREASTWTIDNGWLGLKRACEAMYGEPSGFTPGDEEAPFFSEAYLYPLLGKEEARTVLAAWNRVGRALGIER